MYQWRPSGLRSSPRRVRSEQHQQQQHNTGSRRDSIRRYKLNNLLGVGGSSRRSISSSNSAAKAVEEAVAIVARRLDNSSTSTELADAFITIRDHQLEGGMFRPQDSFWSSSLAGVLLGEQNHRVVVLACHVVIVSSAASILHHVRRDLIEKLVEAVQRRQREEESTQNQRLVVSNLLRALTTLLWQMNPTEADSPLFVEDIPSLLLCVLPDSMEWSCRCFLALDGLIPRNDLTDQWVQKLEDYVLRVPINELGDFPYYWPWSVLRCLAGQIQKVDAVAVHTANVLVQHSACLLIFAPCCELLCQLLPRCHHPTEAGAHLSKICCDMILLQDDGNNNNTEGDPDTWEAAGRLLSTLASLYSTTQPWSRSLRVQNALLDTVELFLEYSPSYIVAVAHALWSISSSSSCDGTAETTPTILPERALKLLASGAELCRGTEYHRDMALAVSEMCYNLLSVNQGCADQTVGDQKKDGNNDDVFIPIDTLGDALADHPHDSCIGESVFAVLGLIQDTESVQQVLQRPNVAEAYKNTQQETDEVVIHILARVGINVSPTISSLRNHAMRRVAAGSRPDLAFQLVQIVEPSAALINRIVESITQDVQSACRALIAVGNNYPHTQLPVDAITERLSVAMKRSPSDCPVVHTRDFHELFCLLVWTAASGADPASGCILLRHVLDIVRLYYMEDAPYEPAILRAAAGAVAAISTHTKEIANARDIAMIAETAYKILESEEADGIGPGGTEAIANYLAFLLASHEKALDMQYQCGMILLIVDILATLPRCERVQEIGCQIFARFTMKRDTNMYLIVVETEALREVARALSVFKKNSRIRNAVLVSLVSLCRLETLREEMVRIDVIYPVAGSLKGFAEDRTTCLNSVRIIDSLVSTSMLTCDQANTVLDALHFAMVHTPPSLALSISIMSCVSKLYDTGTEHNFSDWLGILTSSLSTYCGVESVVEPSVVVLALIVSDGKCTGKLGSRRLQHSSHSLPLQLRSD